ncbi:hypothetical protein FD04_GL002146 [Secundilactobacillus odoratitofui DSM 19909 = JCM 15043]|uniref:Accessory Sec system protein Asp3 n=1 Tax=Secundilactobacillus odoratitofui DSM 19909 = JCM 15043 TaxID=1423776 RepID=A0A0R1LLZ4_9LACO|nr:accessory Sec system protein Asp3 [Secundilactobacillus odoratitofui]KRK96869.1 hypothetical protein FD04_GL002146 [Secundilactobacillus odoratitofui DSM 19909 = JCM 15043]
MQMVHVMHWERALKQAYNYGAQVTFERDGRVNYHAPMMPSGLPIYTWSSKGTTKGYLVPPQLPLLQRGQTYAFDMQADVLPANSVYAMVELLDAAGNSLEQLTYQSLSGTFEMTDSAYDYRICLMNTNHDRVVFKRLVLMPVALKAQATVDAPFVTVTKTNQAPITVVLAQQSGTTANFPVASEGPTIIYHFSSDMLHRPEMLPELQALMQRVLAIQPKTARRVSVLTWGNQPVSVFDTFLDLCHQHQLEVLR